MSAFARKSHSASWIYTPEYWLSERGRAEKLRGMRDLVQAHIQRSIDAKQKLLATALGDVVRGGERLTEVLRSGGKLLMCGNGGSAADAQHIATEYLVRYRATPERPSLPALSLAADSSAITAGGNDFGFDLVFARQIEGLGREGDGLLAISTSGQFGECH